MSFKLHVKWDVLLPPVHGDKVEQHTGSRRLKAEAWQVFCQKLPGIPSFVDLGGQGSDQHTGTEGKPRIWEAQSQT